MNAQRQANCPQCWQYPGTPCTQRGDHLARYQRAERRGLITRTELADAIGVLGVIAGHMVVPDLAAAVTA